MSKVKETIYRGLAAFEGADFSDLCVLTAGVEALGHGFFIDEKSVAGAMEYLLGKSAPAYLTHDDVEEDRLSKEIGLFSGFYRDAAKLRAKHFSFLESYKAEAPEIVAKLTELVQKIPEQIGLSVVFKGWLVWVMQDGSELPAYYGVQMPPGCVRDIPSLRISRVQSIDFVKEPAANPDGILSMKNEDDKNGAEQKMVPLADLDKITDELHALEAKSKEEVGALRAENTTLAATLAEKEKAISEAQNQICALSAKNVEQEKKIAELTAQKEEAEKLSAGKLGVPPVQTQKTSAPSDSGKEMTDREAWDHYDALSAKDPDAAREFRSKRLSRS